MKIAVVGLVAVLIASAAVVYFELGQTANESGRSENSLSGSSQLYQLKFVQESNCPYGSWIVPWGVTLGPQTAVQPSNATLPISGSSRLTSNSSYSVIVFSVPNGNYSYTVMPKNIDGQEQSGSVMIAGSGSEIQVYSFITAMGCSSTSSG